jgi:benzoylformate decarboxylase
MTVMTGKEALIQILRQEKVEYIFGIPGATEVVLMDALENVSDIKFILCLHENLAVGMAEGYSRISGKPGFLNFHTNTGLAAGLALLSNAFQGGVPLIVTAGQQDTRLAAQDPALKGDLVGIAKPFTKWATEIVNTQDIPLVMRLAFKIALHPPQGPVFVALPQNLLQEQLDFEYTAAATTNVGWQPDPEAIRQAAELLLKAHNPIILVEDGVTQNNALDEVVALAEMSGSKVYQQWMSDVNFPVNHPLYMGDLDVNSLSTRALLAEFDVLLVIGSLFFSQAIYTEKSLLPPNLKVIQIDEDDWQLDKNFPSQVAIECNIKNAIAQLNKAYLSGLNSTIKQSVSLRTQKASALSQKSAQILADKAAAEYNHLPIAPTRLMQAIKQALLPGTRVVEDCWSASAILRQTLAFDKARSYLRARGGGSIGWGLPGALGVKLADPSCPVVCISGDGSAAWSIQSLWTAAHYHIPVTFIISANAAYRQVRIMKNKIMGDAFKGRNLGTDLTEPRIDFCSLARAFGLAAVKVEDPSKLDAVLHHALQSNQPNLVEVYVDDSL